MVIVTCKLLELQIDHRDVKIMSTLTLKLHDYQRDHCSPRVEYHVNIQPKLGPKGAISSAELKGPGNIWRIRPKIVNLRPESAPTQDEAKPKMPGAAPPNRHNLIPIDFWGRFRGFPNTIQNF